MTVCLSLLIPINHLTILSSVTLAGGLYFFIVGFHLHARKRALFAIPASKIRSAAIGLVEVNGMAVGPHTMTSPITGKPCFLYHATVWRQHDCKKQEWEKVADETLHLPFFIDDSTGQLLIEPLGADLDLHCDFREEYGSSSDSSSPDDVPPRVSAFLSRHGITSAQRLRVEECAIKPDDEFFIAGTITENPGVQVRPLSVRSNVNRSGANNFSQEPPTPQIIRLDSGAVDAGTQQMSQQSKIAAALTRAGITRPEAWSAAGVPYQSVAVEDNAHPAPVPAHDDQRQQDTRTERLGARDFNLAPPVVLMKGASDSTFVISVRSQKEIAGAKAWKSAAMVWGGAAIMLLGLYTLLTQMQWL